MDDAQKCVEDRRSEIGDRKSEVDRKSESEVDFP